MPKGLTPTSISIDSPRHVIVGASTASSLVAYNLSGDSHFLLEVQPNNVIKGCAVSGKGSMIVAVGERIGASGFATLGATSWKLTLCQASVPESTPSDCEANEYGGGEGVATREVTASLPIRERTHHHASCCRGTQG